MVEFMFAVMVYAIFGVVAVFCIALILLLILICKGVWEEINEKG